MSQQGSTSRVFCEGSSQGEGSSVSEPDAERITHDRGNYFCGTETGVLLVAGKAKEKDGTLFLNDVNAIKARLVHLGIRNETIFCVTPRDQGRQRRNITRAIEDLKDLNIDHFIFFYAGHCNNGHNFLISGNTRANTDDLLSDANLKDMLLMLPAKKMLIVLDSCFSGGTDMGARGGEKEEKAEGEKKEGGEEKRGKGEEGQEEEELEGACGGRADDSKESSYFPRLWDIFDGVASGTRGNGGSGNGNGGNGSEAPQAVQWCSCPPGEESFNYGNKRNGVFTNAILTFIDGLSSGSDVSVLEMHNFVKEDIKMRQEAVLNPLQACDKNSEFHKKFPRFRKL